MLARIVTAAVAIAGLLVVLGCDGTNDSAPFQLLGARRVQGTLLIDVAYECGCGEHDFTTSWDGTLSADAPPATEIRVTHEARNETCEGYCDATLSHDLTPLTTDLSNREPPVTAVRVQVVPDAGASDPIALELSLP